MANVSLGELQSAIRQRDALTKIVRNEIERAGYRIRTATVTQIDVGNRTCRVQFSPNDASVLARIGAIVPTRVGQTVSVSGPIGSLVVVNVFGGAALTGPSSANIGTPTNLVLFGVGPGFVANWTGVDFVDRYELQVSENNTFTQNVRSYQTIGTRISVQGLQEGLTYWVRLRGVSTSGDLGPWTSTSTITIPGYPPSTVPDGQSPTTSPTPVVRPGLGMVIVEWVPVPNNDVVTYEVHASLESGFTPSAGTKVTETTGTFWTIRRLADDSPLPYTSPTFVRLIAKDADGAAPASAQGFAIPDSINSDDFGSVSDSAISDGFVPASSPTDVTVSPGIGYFMVTWSPVVNPDLVTYELHMSTNPLFLPTVNTKVGETVGTMAFLRERPPGFGGGPLTYDTVYYIRVYAKDKDGYAPVPSDAVQSTTQKVGSSDVSNGAISTVHIADAAISSAKIADLAVGSAKIQDAAITTAKIVNAAITGAKIQNASIGTAQIADAAIGTAQIANAAITDAKIASLSADKINVGTLTGISIIGNDLIGNDITGGQIVGSIYRTSLTGSRLEIGAGVGNAQLQFYSGNAAELSPGYMIAGYGTDPYGTPSSFLTITGPKVNSTGGDIGPLFEMWQNTSTGTRLNRLMGTFLINSGRISGDNTALSLGVGNYSERASIDQTESRFYFSTFVAEFRLQTDGNIAVYHNSSAVWSAGVGVSDLRDKTNITIEPTSGATDIVRDISWVSFEYDKPHLPQGRRLGMIAQEIQTAFPQGVREVGDRLLLDPNSLSVLALGAIKDLDARLQALEANVA